MFEYAFFSYVKIACMLPSDSFITIYFFAFSMAIGAVLSPGPVTTAIISQSPRTGWSTGPLVSLGHATLELFMALLITLGLSVLLSQPLPQIIIALLGGILLFWMGGGFLFTAWKKEYALPRADAQMQSLNRIQIFNMGMLTTISNPFWYAWWMTVAATYILQAKALGFFPVVAFYLGHVSVDFIWNTFLSTVIGSGRRILTDGVYNFIMGACGLFLVYLGVQFFIFGISAFPL